MDDLLRSDRRLPRVLEAANPRRKLILLGLFIFAGGPAHGALVLNEVLDRMDQAQWSLRDVSFDFMETPDARDRSLQITGTVRMRGQPYQVRVDQKTPQKSVALTDGETVRLYSPNQGQELEGSFQRWRQMSEIPPMVMDLGGRFTRDRWGTRYQAFYEGYDKGLYQLRFRPTFAQTKTVDFGFTLWIAEDSFLPSRLEISNGTRTTRVDLSKIKTNTGLAAELFELHVPSGTAVVPVTF